MVWHSSLTKENALKRVKKAVLKFILAEKYKNFEDAQFRVNIESLKERREKLYHTFAIKCMKSENPRVNNIFSKKKTIYGINLRKCEKCD